MSFFIEKEVECNFNFDYERSQKLLFLLHLSMRAFRMRRRLI